MLCYLIECNSLTKKRQINYVSEYVRKQGTGEQNTQGALMSPLDVLMSPAGTELLANFEGTLHVAHFKFRCSVNPL